MKNEKRKNISQAMVFILLFGLVGLFAFLLIDRDIAKSIARIKMLFDSYARNSAHRWKK